MKFLHLSDLHFGKRLHGVSLIDDQKHIVSEILKIVDTEKPDAVFIAGDVYDKSVPSAEAVALFDDFLVRLVQRRLKVFVCSGNHDSPERIAFGAKVMGVGGVYLTPVYDGNVTPVTLEDEYGAIHIYMLPFVKPAHVRRFFETEEIGSYTDAVRVAVQAMHVNESDRNVLIAHQFVTGATASGSEDEVVVGGIDNVDASVLDVFDYVALGHIHGAQKVGRETVRYSGTPMKYSFSELNQQKSATIVEFTSKADAVKIRTVPITPLREMREIRGTFEEVYAPTTYLGTTYETDYVSIVLTDENDVFDAYAKLRMVYKNMLQLRYDNARTRQSARVSATDAVEQKTPFQLFEELYEKQNNQPMTETQKAYLLSLIEEVEGGQV